MEPVAPSRVGEQLSLDLGEPWSGQSPRYLTRAFLDSRFGGTGRANRNESKASEKQPDQREDLQLWLFNEDGRI